MYKWLIIVSNENNFENANEVSSFETKEKRDREFDTLLADHEKNYDIRIGKKYFKAQITEWAEEQSQIKLIRTKVDY